MADLESCRNNGQTRRTVLTSVTRHVSQTAQRCTVGRCDWTPQGVHSKRFRALHKSAPGGRPKPPLRKPRGSLRGPLATHPSAALNFI